MVVTAVISDEMHVGQGVALTVRETSVSFDGRNGFFSRRFACAAADANRAVGVLVVLP